MNSSTRIRKQFLLVPIPQNTLSVLQWTVAALLTANNISTVSLYLNRNKIPIESSDRRNLRNNAFYINPPILATRGCQIVTCKRNYPFTLPQIGIRRNYVFDIYIKCNEQKIKTHCNSGTAGQLSAAANSPCKL